MEKTRSTAMSMAKMATALLVENPTSSLSFRHEPRRYRTYATCRCGECPVCVSALDAAERKRKRRAERNLRTAQRTEG